MSESGGKRLSEKTNLKWLSISLLTSVVEGDFR